MINQAWWCVPTIPRQHWGRRILSARLMSFLATYCCLKTTQKGLGWSGIEKITETHWYPAYVRKKWVPGSRKAPIQETRWKVIRQGHLHLIFVCHPYPSRMYTFTNTYIHTHKWMNKYMFLNWSANDLRFKHVITFLLMGVGTKVTRLDLSAYLD